MKEIREISFKVFFDKISKKEGDFRRYIFDFEVDLSEMNIDFSLNFSESIFKKEFRINETSCKKNIIFIKTIFEKKFEALYSVFNEEIDFSKSTLEGSFSVKKSFFKSDVFFDNSIFKEKADFSYCRFFSNIFFIKTQFFQSVNFSYIFFNRDSQVSFVSINKAYGLKDFDIGTPYLIFRAVDFYENVEFRDVDLSRTVFQDSTFEDRVFFKECKFAQHSERDCFYEEIAENEFFNIGIKYFNFFLKKKIIFLIIPDNLKNNKIKELNISDKIIFKNNKIKKKLWKKYFIIEKDYVSGYDFDNAKFKNINNEFNFNDACDILKKIKEGYPDFEIMKDDANIKKYFIFKLKKFNEIKSWENIEFLSRQMKRNLAESTNWQKSSEFYIGEINAKIKKLKLKKEDFMYRYFLYFYGLISGFGEKTLKVLTTMFISIVIIFFIIKFLRYDVDNFDILNYIATLCIPIFEDKGFSVMEFNWSNRGKMFFMFVTLWFYILWFLIILSIQRKFKK